MHFISCVLKHHPYIAQECACCDASCESTVRVCDCCLHDLCMTLCSVVALQKIFTGTGDFDFEAMNLNEREIRRTLRCFSWRCVVPRVYACFSWRDVWVGGWVGGRECPFRGVTVCV